ncbi:MAG TPA: helix-turn-helix domain-containing protein [Trueperaceae bacterium]
MRDEFCPVHASIDLLQGKWVLHIIRALLAGPRGFNAIAREVGGVNSATLTQRLEKLEQLGVISKQVESTMPPRTRYELTQAGYELQDVIDSIDAWARKHIKEVDAGHDFEVVAG